MIVPGPAPSAFRHLRLLRRAAGVIAAVVGLILLVAGVAASVSQSWAEATGTVQSCTSQVSRSGSTRTVRNRCAVSWLDGDRQRTATVDFGADRHDPGDQVAIRVNGDSATADTPAWYGYLFVAIGALLAAGGAAYAVRDIRRSRRPA